MEYLEFLLYLWIQYSIILALQPQFNQKVSIHLRSLILRVFGVCFHLRSHILRIFGVYTFPFNSVFHHIGSLLSSILDLVLNKNFVKDIMILTTSIQSKVSIYLESLYTLWVKFHLRSHILRISGVFIFFFHFIV